MKNKLICKNNITSIMLMLILISILAITLFILTTNNYFTLNKNIEGYTELSLDAKINCDFSPAYINHNGRQLDVKRGSCRGTYSSDDPKYPRCVDIVSAPIGTLTKNRVAAVQASTSCAITGRLNTLQAVAGNKCN